MNDRKDDSSPIDHLIPPEISNDSFYRAVTRVAASPVVRTILEIGSSSGAGSTEALVKGALEQAEPPEIHCIEISRTRFAALNSRWAGVPFVHCHRTSSVTIEQLPTASQIESFYRSTRSRLRQWPLETVLDWLEQDIEYLRVHDLSRPGIKNIRDRFEIACFDAVLIDGSEFAGGAEMAEVYGARFLMLDDIRTFKNWENYRALRDDKDYRRVVASRFTRNGFAIFERRT